MATVDELAQMMNRVQGKQHSLNQEISRLTAENQQYRQAGSPGLAEIATAVGQSVQIAISNANPRPSERQSLVDIKGLGKPPKFKGESARVTDWLRKTTGFLIAAYGSAFRPVIEWVEDQDDIVTNDALEQQFGSLSYEPVDGVLDKNEQVHVALFAVTERESFDVVFWSIIRSRVTATFGPSLGYPAWRSRQVRGIGSPNRAAAALDEDIRTAALDALVPSELDGP